MRQPAPVASSNDVATDRLGANVTLPRPGAALSRAGDVADGIRRQLSATPLSDDGAGRLAVPLALSRTSIRSRCRPCLGAGCPVSLNYDCRRSTGSPSRPTTRRPGSATAGTITGYIERDYESCQQHRQDRRPAGGVTMSRRCPGRDDHDPRPGFLDGEVACRERTRAMSSPTRRGRGATAPMTTTTG